MLFETARDLTNREAMNSWKWPAKKRAARFAGSVNPMTLREVVAELRYWRWLYRVRSALADIGDSEPLVSLRESFAQDQLTVLAPSSLEEAREVARTLVDEDLIGIGSVDDAKELNPSRYTHLCRPMSKQLIYIDKLFLDNHAKSSTYRLVCNAMS